MFVPMAPCRLCESVPVMERMGDGWRVQCPTCWRGVRCPDCSDADEVRRRWNELNLPRKPTRSESLELLDAIESAMCDLEGLRRIPGAMDAWHRWTDALEEIRRLVEEASEYRRDVWQEESP